RKRVGGHAWSEAQLQQALALARVPEQRVEAAEPTNADRADVRAVDVDLHRPVAAEDEIDVLREEAQPQPGAVARDDALLLDPPEPVIREPVGRKRSREVVDREPAGEELRAGVAREAFPAE